MRIAVVAQPFDHIPPRGGASIALWVDEVSSRLARDHRVRVYCRAGEDGAPDSNDEGVQFVRVGTVADERLIANVRRCERGLRKFFGIERDLFHRYIYFGRRYYRNYVRSIAKAIREDDADAIIVPNFSQFVPTLKRHNDRSRIVVVMQCDWLVELPTRVAEERLDDIDVVCGCSAYISDGIARRFPAHAEKCFPLHNATDPEVFSTAGDQDVRELRQRLGLEGKLVVTFVGRVAPEKGVHVLLEAMKRVAATRQDIVLLVVGNVSAQPPSPRWIFERDPEFGDFERLKTDYKNYLLKAATDVESVVRFVGNVPHYELAPYYNVSDIFVHPAVWNEPFGMILTEAMACSRPVISTTTGGIPEVVAHGETGLLVAPGDARALADSILELASKPEERKTMGINGRHRMLSRFTWEHTAERLNEILASRVPNRRASSDRETN